LGDLGVDKIGINIKIGLREIECEDVKRILRTAADDFVPWSSGIPFKRIVISVGLYISLDATDSNAAILPFPHPPLPKGHQFDFPCSFAVPCSMREADTAALRRDDYGLNNPNHFLGRTLFFPFSISDITVRELPNLMIYLC